MKKRAFRLSALTLVLTLILPVLASPALANVTPLGSLVIVEEMLYGEAQTGSLLERIEKIELDIYGKVQEGAVLMRIDRVPVFSRILRETAPLLLNLANGAFQLP